MTATPLASVVSIRSRYSRSTHLVKDLGTGRAERDYVLTSTARGLLDRIVEAMSRSDGAKAWSLTGPYGTGKSSFALFLAEFLAGRVAAERFSGLQGLQPSGEAPFLEILVVGRRAPLPQLLLEGIESALAAVDGRARGLRELAQRARELRERPAGEPVDLDRQVLELLEQMTTQVARSSFFGGILLVIDELGKALEHASLHPGQSDVFVLQEIAELAARNATPTVVLTILHAGMTEYLPREDAVRRAEWAKIHGRFQDVTFAEPPEQMLRLVGQALDRDPSAPWAACHSRLAGELEAPIFAEALRRVAAETILEALPLHPVAALLLWPVFRAEGSQNERSLFAFLASREPSAFRDFLAAVDVASEDEIPLYRADRLYDYLKESFGAALYRGVSARRWSLARSSLERITSDAPPAAAPLVKVISLLALHGEAVGLRAEEDVLRMALDWPAVEIDDALEYLRRRSIVVYRRHRRAYALWDGSDLDMDALYQQHREKITALDVPSALSEMFRPRPFVARAHYYETGTLRTFAVSLMAGEDEEAWARLSGTPSDHDGRIVFLLTYDARGRARCLERALELSEQRHPTAKPLIFATPKPLAQLDDHLLETKVWEQLLGSTPELRTDEVARREAQARLRHAQGRLGNLVGSLLGLPGFRFRPELTAWIHGGERPELDSPRSFSAWLSTICAEYYPDAPWLRNELLNRRRLSSAAAQARNNLLRAMLQHEGERRLGFDGTPPEVSMYEALRRESAFHGRVGRSARHRFCPMSKSWAAAWRCVESFLGETEEQRRPLTELYGCLAAPPIGLREGPMPIVFLTALRVFSDEVALYRQDGMFVPVVQEQIVELLARNPQDFWVQRLRLDPERREIIRRLAEALGAGDGELQILNVVRPLVQMVATLPRFSQRTKALSAETLRLREVVLRAKDPRKLVFEDLPECLGLDRKRPDPEDLAKKTKACLIELERAYPSLLDRVGDQIAGAFGLAPQAAAGGLLRRARQLGKLVVESPLRQFVAAAARSNGADWRARLARAVQSGKAPETWSDHDVSEFGVRLQRVHVQFERVEELVAAAGNGGEPVLRIDLLADNIYREHPTTMRIAPEHQDGVDRATSRLLAELEKIGDGLEVPASYRKAVLSKALIRALREDSGEESHGA